MSASQQLCGAVSALFVFVASKQHRWRRDVGGIPVSHADFILGGGNEIYGKIIKEMLNDEACWAPLHRGGKWLLIHLTHCQTSSSSDSS